VGYERIVSGNRARYYTATDGLGSVTGTTDQGGALVGRREYADFGSAGMDGEGNEDTLEWYTGKDWDEQAGLYYFNARWYEPETGRFTTEDPVRDQDNWYCYANSSPLCYVDPSGLDAYDFYGNLGSGKQDTSSAGYNNAMSQLHPGEDGYEGSVYEKYDKQQVDKINGQGGHYEDSPYIPGPNACLRSKFIGGGKWVADPIPNAPVQLPSATDPEAGIVATPISRTLPEAASPQMIEEGRNNAAGDRKIRLHIAENADAGPCMFGSLFGGVESYLDKNFIRSEQDKFIKACIQNNYVIPAKNWEVENWEAVVRLAIAALRPDPKIIGVRRGPPLKRPYKITPDGVAFTIRYFDSNGHHNLGDLMGNFKWESLTYNSESNIQKLNDYDYLEYFYIWLK